MEEQKKIVVRGKWLYTASFCALLFGGGLALLCPALFPPIAFLGTAYVNLLKLIVVPLLMAEVMASVYGAATTFAKRLLRTVLLFVAMFLVSFLITALLVHVIGPGRGASVTGEVWSGTLSSATLADFVLSAVPSNLFAAMSAGSILPCILFAFAAGFAAAKTRAEKTMTVVSELRLLFKKLLGYIMFFTPIGVFSLIGNAVAQNGAALIGVCAGYILTAYLGCVVVTLLVMILPVWLYAGISPVAYIRRVSKIWLITLSTCSSAATLPNTIRVCNEEFGVPARITGLVVPLGCTIHMCGGAVSFCLLGLFSMQAAELPLTLPMFLYMLLVATLMNMAAPGIPGGGIVLGATYLSILGAPTGFIGIYSGIYRLLDMSYTTVNVTGDITANILIAKSEGALGEASHPEHSDHFGDQKEDSQP